MEQLHAKFSHQVVNDCQLAYYTQEHSFYINVSTLNLQSNDKLIFHSFHSGMKKYELKIFHGQVHLSSTINHP